MKKTVLVADDNPIIVQMLFELFNQMGWNVSVVRTGRELYLLMISQSIKYDLVITDVIMPNWDGPESVEMAKMFGAEMPVLFISGIDKGKEIPAEQFLAKPFTTQQLKEKIEILLENNIIEKQKGD